MFRKIKEGLVYRDADFYSSFPAIANLGNGELIVAFRRAPSYRGMPGLKKDWCSHLDLNSKLMYVRSKDNGMTWSAPRLLFAPDCGGSQDAGLFFDGKTLFANSFIWGSLPAEVLNALKESGQDEYIYHLGISNAASHIGSFALRSEDGGKEWEGPFFPEPLPGYPEALPGKPLRMHNRTNIIKMPDGRLLFPGQALHYRPSYISSVVIYESKDNGGTWQYLSTAAPDKGVAVLEEPSLYLADSGRLVLILRTHKGYDGVAYADRRANLWRCFSDDGGKTWSEPEDLGFHGEPAATARMDDGRALLVYGYRRAPFGVRGRICNGDLSDAAIAEEFIIRDDNDAVDCGYPWIAPMGNNQYTIVYYLNQPGNDGAGGIYATLAEIF